MSYEVPISESITWQYDRAPRMRGLLDAVQKYADASVTDLWTRIESEINLSTSGNWGMAVWANLLGVQRPYLPLTNWLVSEGALYIRSITTGAWHKVVAQDTMGAPAFAVETVGSMRSGSEPIPAEYFRRMLQARFFWMNSNASLKALNQYFSILFPDKQVQITDHLDMSITVSLSTSLNASEQAIIASPDFAPSIAGVEMNIIAADPMKTFGFDGSALSTWCDNSTTVPAPDGIGVFFR